MQRERIRLVKALQIQSTADEMHKWHACSCWTNDRDNDAWNVGNRCRLDGERNSKQGGTKPVSHVSCIEKALTARQLFMQQSALRRDTMRGQQPRKVRTSSTKKTSHATSQTSFPLP
mmetsp:Transcript_4118/g.25974  ORF Transcript_4118/g.25974 Transcript_4118/m.25974 type:complete len:117 (+) Transcript_4118:3326-3676(+)